MVKAEALKKRQVLEQEEARLKAKKEQLEMLTEIQATSAKLDVFTEFENSSGMDMKPRDGMNEYFDTMVGFQETSEAILESARPSADNVTLPVTKPNVRILEDQLLTPSAEITQSEGHSSWVIESGRTVYLPITPRQSSIREGPVVRQKERPQQAQIAMPAPGGSYGEAANQDKGGTLGRSGAVMAESYGETAEMGGIIDIMRHQNTITEVLVKQQQLSSLPPLSIPTFKGDPLEYKFFVCAFEHGIEDKTENCKDRLYFLEQFTMGQPSELVRSCQHMEPSRGYKEAKRLLKKYFGDDYKIATAHINKALSWLNLRMRKLYKLILCF